MIIMRGWLNISWTLILRQNIWKIGLWEEITPLYNDGEVVLRSKVWAQFAKSHLVFPKDYSEWMVEHQLKIDLRQYIGKIGLGEEIACYPSDLDVVLRSEVWVQFIKSHLVFFKDSLVRVTKYQQEIDYT